MIRARSATGGETEAATRRSELLALLRSLPEPASITDLAARIGVHPNTVRFHLETLTETGQVERVSVARQGPGRPALMFQAHPGMDPAGPRNYQLLAEVLISDIEAHPEPARHAIRIGTAWGAKLGRELVARAPGKTQDDRAVRELVGLLDEAGFAPQLDERNDELNLRHCPFLELAADAMDSGRPAVVCALHLGLLQGAASELASSSIVEGLDPFVEPGRCVVRLASART